MHTICVDIGSTITKIIEVDKNNKILNKNIYQKEEPKKLLKDFIESNNIKQEDIEAIDYAMCSGVKGIFTAHGNDIEDVCTKTYSFKIISSAVFLSGMACTRIKHTAYKACCLPHTSFHSL